MIKIKRKKHKNNLITRTIKVIVPPTGWGSVHSKWTVQLVGCKYFPVTYCNNECFASGAKDGCVIAASVTNPATLTETTNIPPENKNNKTN